MSAFERLLVPGSTERPACRCGEAMEVASIERLSEGRDAAIRVYQCTTYRHRCGLRYGRQQPDWAHLVHLKGA